MHPGSPSEHTLEDAKRAHGNLPALTPRPAPPSGIGTRAGSRLTLAARSFVEKLLGLKLLDSAALDAFLAEKGNFFGEFRDDERLGGAFVQAGLLTSYQLERVLSGQTHGLVLGSYRVLKMLGSGGMGKVFLAEHCLLKRRGAVKVLPIDDDCHPSVLERFYAEIRVLAELRHPNIVLAFDAGEVPPSGPNMPGLIYLVMEMVDGGDLEQHVRVNGPCAVADACDYVRQAACGLQAAHDRHLIHRDVKPSNLLRTGAGEIKLVDFGLARQFCSRLTDPRSLLGSIEFMAPEQSHDPSAVGKEADIYGLGATLFWLLTAESPYPFNASLSGALRSLQQHAPRRVRQLRPEIPDDLDALLARMLDRNPAHRPPLAVTIMNALAPFLAGGRPTVSPILPRLGDVSTESKQPAKAHVLVVDDDTSMRVLHRLLLQSMGCTCVEVVDGESALSIAAEEDFDLVLLDPRLPDMSGYEVCKRLREDGKKATLKIIIVSGEGGPNDLVEAFPRGADDTVSKPFEPRQLVAKIEHALSLKAAQDRSAALAEQVLEVNRQLQFSLQARAADVRQAHDALLFAVARMAESRDGETAGHLRRMQLYTRALGRLAAQIPPWKGQVDDRFLDTLERCVPLHDIGKIGLPQDILLKPGALSASERAVVETHPLIGDHILEALGREYGASLEFLGTARAIVRHHHERFDGRGYPDKLAGDAIPAAARLTAVADVYDALRRRRLYKPATTHAAAVRLLTDQSTGQFDPVLLHALQGCHGEFERVFREVPD